MTRIHFAVYPRVQLLAVFFLTLVGCAVITLQGPTARRRSNQAGPRIDHAAHAERGLECVDCHGGDGGTEPGAPEFEVCMLCHLEIDEDKWPEERWVANVFFTADEKPRWRPALTPYAAEVRFSHAAHGDQVTCVQCHGNLGGRVRRRTHVLSMEQCNACHQQRAVGPLTCAACHTEVRANRPPADHGHLWTERHGEASRRDHSGTARACVLCHTQEGWCDRCHLAQPPKSHTQTFCRRTHGLIAAIDRTSCQTCHQTDFCARCHEQTAPRSHRGSWARRTNTHCTQCHFPVRSEPSCGACHFSEPTHSTASPKPAWHNNAMNCRGCHIPPTAAGAQAVPHFDNQMDCNFCHH